MGLSVSLFLLRATSKEKLPLPPIKPKTKMNINGKPILKITADGLRKIAFKLALVIANIAFTWL